MVTRRGRGRPPQEVTAIVAELERFLEVRDAQGRRHCDAKCGVYAFYDYDSEPIYVGQTAEQLRVRMRRHLTSQRTDAVAMSVLDPFEVADVEAWPLWDLEGVPVKAAKGSLNAAEYTVFQKVLTASTFGAVLNEVPVLPAPVMELAQRRRQQIVPESVYANRVHADTRLARRANTIGRLAQIHQRARGPEGPEEYPLDPGT